MSIVILDPDTKKYLHVENLKIVEHILPDEKGKHKPVKYVEFTVIGNNRKWKNGIQYTRFKMANSSVEI